MDVQRILTSEEIRSTDPRFDLPLTERLLLADPLYVRGDLQLLQSTLRVAIVGTREASPEGLARARRLARELAQAGVVVVSGLAAGIDTEAHKAAIAAGGRTIAVLGTPLDRHYPPENRELQEEIASSHLLISQFPKGAKIGGANYLARNRTMALLAHASVIVECGDTSGTLSQASETMRYHRPLFLLPSALHREDLQWPQRFMRKGARILTSVAELLEALR